MSNRRVSFIPDQPPMFTKHQNPTKLGTSKKRVTLKIWSFEIPKGSRFSPSRLFKHIEAEMSKALRFVSSKRRKVSNSGSLARSRSYAETVLDSQRAEAIEDCIEFLNSSSTLQRSSSVSSSC